MIQLVMLVLGVYYAYKLANLRSSGFEFGFPPNILARWRDHRRQQYIWGIVAGWGSLVAGLIVLVAVQATTKTCVTSYYYNFCDNGDTEAAFTWMVIVTAVILIGGIILSIVQANKAKALEQQARAMGMGVPYGAQPGWGQPPGPPMPGVPMWGNPPTQTMWGAPPAGQAGWGAPPPAQAGWGTPPGAQPGWGAPPPPQPGWGAPAPGPSAWGAWPPPPPPTPPAAPAPPAGPQPPAASPGSPESKAK